MFRISTRYRPLSRAYSFPTYKVGYTPKLPTSPRPQSSTSRSIRLAFGFQSGVGKDTAHDLLVSLLASRTRVHRLKFATPIYNITTNIQETTSLPIRKDRHLLQTIGTWGRQKDPNLWVNLFEKNLKRFEHTSDALIVTDLRFPNEAEMLKRHGFKLIHIDRSSAITNCRLLQHQSEYALENYTQWDYTINNDKDKDHLQHQLITLLHSHYPETLEWIGTQNLIEN